MLKRLALALALMAAPALAPAADPPPGGLHTKDWFAVTFLDMREDLATARDEGKRLAVVVEQPGCIYCAKMHEELLTDPEVADFIKEHFMVVQLNMFGDHEVTDLDGEVLSERKATRRWAVTFTPTILFLPDAMPPEDVTLGEAAVQRMQGAFGKWTFLNMFRWIEMKGYEKDQHFQKWHAGEIEKLRAEGRL
jgi:thioredoxin-related protein